MTTTSIAPTTTETVEFVGVIGTRNASEVKALTGPSFDPDFTLRFAQAHESAGFDRALIGYSSSSPETLQIAAQVAAATERLGLLVAHRPGFVAPTLAARAFATLDRFSKGRVALHTIMGGPDAEQRRDGDYLTKDERYVRTDEYLGILRRAWGSWESFDHRGTYYAFEDFGTEVLPHRPSGIPLYVGGSSAAAYRVGGKHANTFTLRGEPLAETAEQITSVRAAAEHAGRTTAPGISVSVRPILGVTEESAWERAHQILQNINTNGRKGFLDHGRLRAAAESGEVHDRALWMPSAQAVRTGGNATALVGTPETVAAALLDYVDIGATTLLLSGYDPYDDAIDYGRELLPLVRQELAHRAATRDTAVRSDYITS